tara:strand:+ start:549 stop:803 length:255 start_codon:yes stop_codon:yes gene_type:complete
MSIASEGKANNNFNNNLEVPMYYFNENAFNNTFSKAAWFGIGCYVTYKLTRRRVKATGLTVATIAKDAKNYVAKTYRKSYEKTL